MRRLADVDHWAECMKVTRAPVLALLDPASCVPLGEGRSIYDKFLLARPPSLARPPHHGA